MLVVMIRAFHHNKVGLVECQGAKAMDGSSPKAEGSNGWGHPDLPSDVPGTSVVFFLFHPLLSGFMRVKKHLIRVSDKTWDTGRQVRS